MHNSSYKDKNKYRFPILLLTLFVNYFRHLYGVIDLHSNEHWDKLPEISLLFIMMSLAMGSYRALEMWLASVEMCCACEVHTGPRKCENSFPCCLFLPTRLVFEVLPSAPATFCVHVPSVGVTSFSSGTGSCCRSLCVTRHLLSSQTSKEFYAQEPSLAVLGLASSSEDSGLVLRTQTAVPRLVAPAIWVNWCKDEVTGPLVVGDCLIVNLCNIDKAVRLSVTRILPPNQP